MSCCASDYSGPLPKKKCNPSCIPVKLPKTDPYYSSKEIYCQNYVRMAPTLDNNCKILYEHVMQDFDNDFFLF